LYRVLSPRPKTEKTGEITYDSDGEAIKWHKVISWPELGTARDMQEAREKFGGRPVLEYIGNLQ
jgi:hypothetical protein